MDIRQLQYLITAAECGTFSAAARQNYISQPALSKSIRALEEELGVKLFFRYDRHTELTPVGHKVYTHAKALIAEYQEILGVVATDRSLISGRLRIGVAFGAGSTLIYQRVSEYMERHNIEVSFIGVHNRDISQHLLEQKMDVGVSIQHTVTNIEGIESLNIGKVRICLLVSDQHPLAARADGVSFSELAEETFIMPVKDFVFSDIIYENCKQAGFEPKSNIALNRYDIIFDLVRQNHGIAIIATELWNVSFSKNLVCIPLIDGIVDYMISLSVLKELPKKSAAKQFFQCVKDDKIQLLG